MILTLEGTPAAVGRAVEAVRRFALGNGLGEAKAAALGVAVDEAVTNVVRHAYDGDPARSLTLSLSAGRDAVQVDILDNGHPFDPLAGEAALPEGGAEERDVGGLGLLLMRELVDEARYIRDGDRNKLMLRAFVGHSPDRREPGLA
ncbi:MAG: ATP-binding protein [Hyphomicrobium sp.]|nr:ATP-binding protein [Hyphomicrobium sp.]